LTKIHARCETLVKEIGGASVPLHRWENIIPSPHSQPDAESFAVSFVNCVGNTFSVAVANLRISRFNPVETASPGTTVAQSGSPAPSRNPHSKRKAVNPGKPIAQAGTCNDCLDLMHSVMAYRHEPIHSEANEDPRQILHAPRGRVDLGLSLREALLPARFSRSARLLEAPTIAAAVGVRDSGQEKKLIAVEPAAA